MQPLKPGMLAMVIGLKKDAQLNGTCVTLVELVNPNQNFTIPGSEYVSRMHRDWAPSWVCVGKLPKRIPSPVGGWGLFKPENLMPLEDDDHHFWGDTGIYNDAPGFIRSTVK
jgi:hypothetical protein